MTATVSHEFLCCQARPACRGPILPLLLLLFALPPACSRSGYQNDEQRGDGDAAGPQGDLQRTDAPAGDGQPVLEAAAPRDTGADSTPPDSQSAGDQTVDTAPLAWPGYTLLPLQPLWAAANTLAWQWNCAGTLADFEHYALCYSTDQNAVATGTAPCLTTPDDFALGVLSCANTPITSALYGLNAGSKLYARLEVQNTAGQVLRSSVVSQQTLAAPTRRFIIFNEALPSGAWLLSLAISAQNPSAGTYGLTWSSTSSTGNLHIGDLSFAGLNLTAQDFAGALLEFYLDAPVSVPVCIYLETSQDIAEYCPDIGYLPVDGRPGYQRFQIPLSRLILRDARVPLDPSSLKDVVKFMIGAPWGSGTLWLDEISIRY